MLYAPEDPLQGLIMEAMSGWNSQVGRDKAVANANGCN
jgi:hypothetical protein